MKYHFRGGYRLIPTDKIDLLLKSSKKLNKDCFRVWFACNELKACTDLERSFTPLTLKDVLQRPFSLSLDEEEKRSVAISSGRIRKAEKKLRTLGLFQPTDEKRHKTKVPKCIYRAGATGQITKREALILLWYFKRRKAQNKKLNSLYSGQRYARLLYSELSHTGMDKASISKTIKTLEHKKIIRTVPQPQLSTNRFGICVVDGSLILSDAEILSDALSGEEGKHTKKTRQTPFHSATKNANGYREHHNQERTKPLETFLEKERTVVDLQERRELLKRQCEELKHQAQKGKIAATA